MKNLQIDLENLHQNKILVRSITWKLEALSRKKQSLSVICNANSKYPEFDSFFSVVLGAIKKGELDSAQSIAQNSYNKASEIVIDKVERGYLMDRFEVILAEIDLLLGNGKNSYKKYTDSLSFRMDFYGITHPETLHCQISLGNASSQLKMYDAAISIYEEVTNFVDVHNEYRIHCNSMKTKTDVSCSAEENFIPWTLEKARILFLAQSSIALLHMDNQHFDRASIIFLNLLSFIVSPKNSIYSLRDQLLAEELEITRYYAFLSDKQQVFYEDNLLVDKVIQDFETVCYYCLIFLYILVIQSFVKFL